MFTPALSSSSRVNLERTLKPSDIRYTLDGSEPTAASPIYQGQTLVFGETTTLKAGLFVGGQLVGRPVEAVYRKAGQLQPLASALKPLPQPTTVAQVLPLLAQADARLGERLFHAPSGAGCFNCHRLGEHGNSFGPDLNGIAQRTNARHVIESILAPNAVITEGFNTLLVETKTEVCRGVN